MDKAAAAGLLTSKNPHDRLRGARYFAAAAESGDLPLLRAALREEEVSWVQSALKIAVEKAGKALSGTAHGKEPLTQNPEDITSEQTKSIRSEVTREIARRLVHEVENILGPVRLFARQEMPDFEKSKTKQQLERLADMIEAIDALGNAASSPKREDFDLADFVDKIVSVECVEFSGQVQREGPRPLTVRGDRKLLRLALCNGLRNAVEAVSNSVKQTSAGLIVVAWDATDVDYWISILDDGAGIVGSVEGAFEHGFSTKDGHLGMGLPTAKQAMESLGGSATLEGAQTGGARLILRWPIPEELPK